MCVFKVGLMWEDIWIGAVVSQSVKTRGSYDVTRLSPSPLPLISIIQSCTYPDRVVASPVFHDIPDLVTHRAPGPSTRLSPPAAATTPPCACPPWPLAARQLDGAAAPGVLDVAGGACVACVFACI